MALVRDCIIGFCMLRGWEEGYAIPTLGILVHNQHQRCGIGTEMVRFAICEARRLKCSQLKLSVHKSNKLAVELYLKLGFKEIERCRVIVDGKLEEKLTMVRSVE